MILRASHHPFIYPFFKVYSIWKISRNFQKVVIKGDIALKDKPLLLVSNHMSWWDGFWVMYLNLKLLHRRFHFMMLEEQLGKRLFLNKSGGFSIRKGSRSIVETLNYTVELLNDKRNLVLMFPQGEIQSLQTRKFIFEKGIDHIVKRTGDKIQIIFILNLVEYYSNPKPTLFIHLAEYDDSLRLTGGMEKAYQNFFETVIEEYTSNKYPE
jgi:1-acyl-sn-glycerol-3-phosphate acyltransferase